MGYGFRVGFLGLLHMEVVKERLQREFELAVILTVPSVIYKAKLRNGEEIEITNPSEFPDEDLIEKVYEPFSKLDIITPPDYMGDLINLAQVEKRGNFSHVSNAGKNRVVLHFEIPLADLIFDFFDKMKAISKGCFSMINMCNYCYISNKIGIKQKRKHLHKPKNIEILYHKKDNLKRFTIKR